MSDKLYFGIDGGGTKTALALMNSDLKIISYLSNDSFKRKIKKILYKIKYEVLK